MGSGLIVTSTLSAHADEAAPASVSAAPGAADPIVGSGDELSTIQPMALGVNRAKLKAKIEGACLLWQRNGWPQRARNAFVAVRDAARHIFIGGEERGHHGQHAYLVDPSDNAAISNVDNYIGDHLRMERNTTGTLIEVWNAGQHLADFERGELRCVNA
jgi:hypothetical protein